eukprot:TRINITY_DN2639_c0_g1_i1.p1 TRINITY_DN2639_c0_g1~~TRINITY_DN2639_c0_g1_i1.p1  ORF type:complete len:90 (+),score=30.67 TRINITY_DN2639_c0_g1_i1:152-421(+)
MIPEGVTASRVSTISIVYSFLTPLHLPEAQARRCQPLLCVLPAPTPSHLSPQLTFLTLRVHSSRVERGKDVPKSHCLPTYSALIPLLRV